MNPNAPLDPTSAAQMRIIDLENALQSLQNIFRNTSASIMSINTYHEITLQRLEAIEGNIQFLKDKVFTLGEKVTELQRPKIIPPRSWKWW